MTDSVHAWSQTAADNATSDATINWAEFQTPASVNDSARAMMARVAQLISDMAPKRSSTGSANAYVVAADAAGAALRDGEQITFIPNHTNTSACTINVDGRGAKPWRPAPSVDYSASNILSGVPVTAFYRSSSDEWLSPGTGYYVTSMASGVALQSITARLPQIGDLTISYAPSPGAGRIRLTEATQSILKSAYPELNSYLSGISYPWGSTATHFSLPPAAGYALRFASTTSTIDTSGARTAGSTQSDQNKTATIPATGLTAATTVAPHSHTFSALDAVSNNGTGSGGGFTSVSGPTGGKSTDSTTATATTTLAGSATLAGGDEVRVKNVAFHCDVVASTALSAAQVAVFGFPFQWDTGITAANPGAGRIRCNNATPASMTAIYISNTDGWAVSLETIFAGLAVGNVLSFSKVGAQATRLVIEISSVPTAGSGFYTIPVTVVASGGTLSSNDQLAFEYGKGSVGPTGATGPNTGLDYSWSTSTSGDPGAGKILANNATLASATAINISKTGRNSESLGTVIGLWDDSTSTIKGHGRIFTVADRTEWMEYDVTGLTDNATYWTVAISNVVAGLDPEANDIMSVMFEAKGDKGDIGDVSAASAFAVDNRIIRSDGTAKVIQASGITLDDSDNVSGLVNLAQTGYHDLTEISAPSSPSANIARIYAKELSGATKIAYKDAAGTETILGAGAAGVVAMYRTADGGNDPSINPTTWVVALPDGTFLDTTGTTTMGLQEAINYAARYAYELNVIGGAIKPQIWGVGWGGAIASSGVQTFVGTKTIRITTSAAHNLTVGTKIAIYGTSGAVGGIPQAEFDAIEKTVTATPTSTTFEFSVTTTNATSSATGGGASAQWQMSGQDVAIIQCTTPIVIPPIQGVKWRIHVTLNFGGSPAAAPAISFDSVMVSDVEILGQIVVANTTYTAAIQFKPTKDLPQDPYGPVVTSSVFKFSSIIPLGNIPCIDFDLTNASIRGCKFYAIEPNGGSYGVRVTNVQATTTFFDNLLDITGSHAHSVAAVALGTSATNGTNIQGNTIRAIAYPDAGAKGLICHGKHNSGTFCVYDDEGTPTTGIEFGANSTQNDFTVTGNEAATPIVDAGSINVVRTPSGPFAGAVATITPTQITAQQDNYAPTGINAARVLRVSSDATRTITGITSGYDGRELRLNNVGSFALILADNNGSSTAANRMRFFGNAAYLFPGDAISLRYDNTLTAWVLAASHPLLMRGVQGGTGIASYAVGDLLYADSASSLAKLAGVATGNALISGGVTTAPAWGKVGLTTHISGTLAVGNGGLGITSGTNGGVPYFSSTSTIASSAALTANAIVKGGGAGAAPAASGVSIDASNNVSGAALISSTTLSVGGGGTPGYAALFYGSANGLVQICNSSTGAGAGDGAYFGFAGDTNFRFGLLEGTGSNIDVYTNGTATKVASFTGLGSTVMANGALATTATDGYLYITSCAGPPTGVPTAFTGRVAIQFDSTNNKLYVYDGAWLSTAALT